MMKGYEEFLRDVEKNKCMPGFSEEKLKSHYEGQCELLRLFKIVINFCEDNNLSYFCSGGTLLGAIRENGFITHDADVDIVLLDEEYDFFFHNFPKLHKNAWLSNFNTDPNVDKIYGSRDVSSCKNKNKPVGKINRLMSTEYIYDPWYAHAKNAWLEGVPYHGGVRVDILKFSTDGEYVNPTWSVGEWKVWEKNSFKFKVDQVFPLKKVRFEDINVNVVKNYDLWLTNSFGKNYMKPFPGMPHEYYSWKTKDGKITKMDKNNLQKMYADNYKHLYQ